MCYGAVSIIYKFSLSYLQELIATWRDLGLLIQSLMVTRQKVIEQKVLGFGPHVGSNYITGRSQS